MRVPIAPAALALALLPSCFVSPSTTQVSGGVTGDTKGGCSRCGGAAGGAAGGGGNSSGGGQGASSGGTAGSSGGNGTGAASSSGGEDGGCQLAAGTPDVPFDCTGLAPDYAGNAGDCTGEWFGTTITDYTTCDAVCGISVDLLGPDGVQLAGDSTTSQSPSGDVHFCLSSNPVYTPSVSGDGYADFTYGEIQGQLTTPIPHLGVFNQHTLEFLQGLVPGLNLSNGSAIFFTYSIDGACNSYAQSEGWTISLAFEDGGAYPAGSYEVVYIDDGGYPDKSLTATSTFGVAFMVNIDTTLGQFAVPVYGNADAGPCIVQNQALGFTGRLYVAAQSFSEQGIFLP